MRSPLRGAHKTEKYNPSSPFGPPRAPKGQTQYMPKGAPSLCPKGANGVPLFCLKGRGIYCPFGGFQEVPFEDPPKKPSAPLGQNVTDLCALVPQRGKHVVGRAYPCPFGARAKRETARALWAYIADPGSRPVGVSREWLKVIRL